MALLVVLAAAHVVEGGGHRYCDAGAGRGSSDGKLEAPAYMPFKSGTGWGDLKTLVHSHNASRAYVELAGGLKCFDLYYFGVLTRFDHALLTGDVVIDCDGPVVPDGIGERPDLDRGAFSPSRTRFRPQFSPRLYVQEREASKTATGRFFQVGVSLTYSRDANFEMFFAVDVSRWWYILQMLSVGWAPDGPVAIVLSGRDGGSGEAPHSFVREAVELLVGTLPFDAEIVTLDQPLFFEQLWVPGFAAMNLAECAVEDSDVTGGPHLSDVLHTFRIAARARPLDPVRGHSSSQLHCAAGSQEKIFVTRLDGAAHGLDGVSRHLAEEEQLIADLMDSGFGVVSAADYSSVEKAALFANTTVLVVEAGAGVTNAMFLAPNATVVVICSPDHDMVRFGTRMCDWFSYWSRTQLAHLDLKVVTLYGLTSRPQVGFNQGYKFEDYNSALRKILHAAQSANRCDAPGSGRWDRPPAVSPSTRADAVHSRAPAISAGVALLVLLVGAWALWSRGEWPAKAASAFVVLTGACVLQTVLIRASRDENGELPYDPSALVLLAEATKLLLALSATWYTRRSGRQPTEVALQEPGVQWRREALYYLVPAVTYAVQNNLVFLGLTYLDAPTFTMLASMKIAATAFLHFLVFKRVPSEVQCISVVLLAAGIAVSKLQTLGSDGGSDALANSGRSASSDLLLGSIVMLANATLSAFSGVSNEWLIKRTNPSTPLMQKNAALYLWGVVVNGCWLLAHSGSTATLTRGMDRWMVWIIVATNAATGLAVSLNIKHANVVVSSFATAVAVFLAALVSALFDEFVLSVQFWLGAVIFSGSLFLYTREKPAGIASKQEPPSIETRLLDASAGSE